MNHYLLSTSAPNELWEPLYPEVEHLWQIMSSWHDGANMTACWEQPHVFCLRAYIPMMSSLTGLHSLSEWAIERGFVPTGKEVYTGIWVEFTRGHWTLQLVHEFWHLEARIIHDTLD